MGKRNADNKDRYKKKEKRKGEGEISNIEYVKIMMVIKIGIIILGIIVIPIIVIIDEMIIIMKKSKGSDNMTDNYGVNNENELWIMIMAKGMLIFVTQKILY